jgi:hypothetical protein
MAYRLDFIYCNNFQNIVKEEEEEFDTIEEVCERLKTIINDKSKIIIEKYPEFILHNNNLSMIIISYYDKKQDECYKLSIDINITNTIVFDEDLFEKYKIDNYFNLIKINLI